MSFLYPKILWALTALLIPIAVHLFNFRKHKLVYFSNTAMLKTIQQENAKTKKLKYLVALLLRCLFFAALVLAFAFPYRPEEASKIDTEEGLVGVYIDNSMSMKAQSKKTTLLEDARESARHLVEQCAPSARFLLMTNSFEAQNEYPMNRDEMLDQLDRMNLDGPPVSLNAVMDRFGMLRKRHGFDRATLFVYSDFQGTMFDLSGVKADSLLQVVAVPVQTEVNANISIDSVWLGSPIMQMGLDNEVHVLVSNRGEKAVKGLPVNLTMEGKAVASTTVDVEGNDKAELTMQFLLHETGSIRCTVSLADYPITFDDVCRFVVEVRPSLNVVELGAGSDRSDVSLVFSDDPQYNYVRMDPSKVDLQTLSKAQLVVVSGTSALNETMQRTLLDDAAEGASVVFFHDEGKTIDTNTMAVGDLALRHDFFNDVILDFPQHADLPTVKQHVRLKPDATAVTLMYLDNGDPLLTMRPMGKGYVFDIATALDAQWSDMADHSIFVPLMLKMAFLGGGVSQIAYTLGRDKVLVFGDLEVGGNEMKIAKDGGGFEMMPAHEVRNNRVCVYFQDDLPEAGFYDLLVNDSVRRVMAWNDSRLESDMHFVGKDDLARLFKEQGQEVSAVLSAEDFANHDLVQAMARKSSLWRWFVLLALLALAGEVAVLRFWK